MKIKIKDCDGGKFVKKDNGGELDMIMVEKRGSSPRPIEENWF